MKKYILPIGSEIERRNHNKKWETFFTTKEAYYEESELFFISSDSVSLVSIKINDPVYDLILVKKKDLMEYTINRIVL